MDLNNKQIDGKFYYQELQRVQKPDSYTVEKVMKRRTVAGKTQYLVKWLGYGKEFNSWVDNQQTIKR